MKEKLYTIPLMDALKSQDECPFCFIERKLEQHALDFVLGSGASYMEDDIRAQTDKFGFCPMHFKKMYEYGNRLGAGLILKTHIAKKNQELHEQIQQFASAKSPIFPRFKKQKKSLMQAKTSIGVWAKEQSESCYICNSFSDDYTQYLDTFFQLFQKNPEFRELLIHSKGFCIPHFGDLVEMGDSVLSESDKGAFFSILFPLMEENMKRVYDDLDWFCDKFDYRYKDADWRTSKDALPRGMQKAAGGHPADEPYVSK